MNISIDDLVYVDRKNLIMIVNIEYIKKKIGEFIKNYGCKNEYRN